VKPTDGEARFVQRGDQPDPDLAELDKIATDSLLLQRLIEGLPNPPRRAR
jgi:hypothetical protein